MIPVYLDYKVDDPGKDVGNKTTSRAFLAYKSLSSHPSHKEVARCQGTKIPSSEIEPVEREDISFEHYVAYFHSQFSHQFFLPEPGYLAYVDTNSLDLFLPDQHQPLLHVLSNN